MFREIILPIFRSTRLCVTVCGIMDPRCCRPVAKWTTEESAKTVSSANLPATLGPMPPPIQCLRVVGGLLHEGEAKRPGC